VKKVNSKEQNKLLTSIPIPLKAFLQLSQFNMYQEKKVGIYSGWIGRF
jgi:hypothetical protein